jgi:hypothetical protein
MTDVTVSDPALIRSEEADDYHAVVAQLNDDWRVIVCRAGIQWILQHRAGERHGRTRWAGRSFCRTSEALNRVSRERAGPIDPAALAILESLPARFVEEPAPCKSDADLTSAAA